LPRSGSRMTMSLIPTSFWVDVSKAEHGILHERLKPFRNCL
jgi:hypothetical protein